MFTGIIENLSEIKEIIHEGDNLSISLFSDIAKELKIDQSVSHNGICLTVVDIDKDIYTVTAIKETIIKSSIKTWQKGDLVNIERAMKLGDRLDGHMVQGHIDQTAVCKKISEENGSWYFDFEYTNSNNLTIEKGSIAINGVSLTIVDSGENRFSVAIIPYTYNHTNFKNIIIGSLVNIEFDLIGKYISKIIKNQS